MSNEETSSESCQTAVRRSADLWWRKLNHDLRVQYDDLKHNTPTNANNVLCAGQFKCDTCQFKKKYSTGADEYPAYTTIEYCSKGHWEGGDIPSADDIYNWSNCADFLPCT